ncbi:MAG: transcription termination factor Rho [Gemmatimonadota bacterium]
MTERRRPYRRGRRGHSRPASERPYAENNPYRDGETITEPGASADAPEVSGAPDDGPPPPSPSTFAEDTPRQSGGDEGEAPQAAPPRSEEAPTGGDQDRPPTDAGGAPAQGGQYQGQRPDFQRREGDFYHRNGRRHRRHRGRGRREFQQQAPPQPVVADSETTGWFEPSRDGGFIRRAPNSYLAEPGDAWVSPALVRQYGLRHGDSVTATTGHDHRHRVVTVDVQTLNGLNPSLMERRPDFQSLTATYPEKRITLETGRPAKGGPELTRRCIDIMAPIGFGQRALIVAPARAGKTMLLHAITEGIALNYPEAVLLILLVDERPEEVSEAISWGVGEVIASSFDQPAQRHVEVTEMTMEHARRLVELGRDVIIVLDSLTRMARAHNTAERGTGRTLSGGLDATAMAKPKAFFGSARSVHPKDGGGSLTIISTALVETGSRMDDVIFEEFKGTGNCEIKLDRALAEKRIFPAFDIAASGTRREEKLYRPDQIEKIYTLRRGLQQMPPQSAMEWMIKRIANTPNNDALLDGL